MSWEQAVRGHTAWTVHGSALAQADADGWPDDENTRDAVDRMRWVLRDAWARFEGMDARQVMTSTLDALQSQFTQATDSLVNLRSNPAYAASVYAACDAILSTVASWPRPPASAEVQVVHKTAEAFKVGMEKALTGFEDTIAEAAAETDKTKAEFAASTAALTTTLTTLSARIEGQTTRLDVALNTAATRYEEAENARSATFEDAAALRGKAFDDERDRVATLTSEHLSRLEAMLGEARNTLQAIGVTTTASHYGSYAKRQSRAGLAWALGAVLLGVGGALGALWALHSVASGDQSWQLISLKSLASTIVLAVAGYAAAQASGHRHEERRARRMELGLAALDPFLANVDGEDVKTLRLALGAELFAAPAKEQERGLSPLASLQQALTQKSLAGRIDVSAGVKEANQG